MIDSTRPLYRPEFPRSNSYDPEWVMTHQMGPNALWLMEWLTEGMRLAPGMRVLDLVTPQSNGKVFWEDGCWSFKTAAWYERLWKRCGMVHDVRTDTLPDGWRHWRDFERALAVAGKSIFPSDAEVLDADGGRFIGFVRARARRGDSSTMNLYDPALGATVGVDR